MLLFFLIWCGTGFVANIFLFFIYFRSPKHLIECELYFEQKYKSAKPIYTNLMKDGVTLFHLYMVSLLVSIVVPPITILQIISAVSRFSLSDVFDKSNRNNDYE